MTKSLEICNYHGQSLSVLLVSSIKIKILVVSHDFVIPNFIIPVPLSFIFIVTTLINLLFPHATILHPMVLLSHLLSFVYIDTMAKQTKRLTTKTLLDFANL